MSVLSSRQTWKVIINLRLTLQSQLLKVLVRSADLKYVQPETTFTKQGKALDVHKYYTEPEIHLKIHRVFQYASLFQTSVWRRELF